MVSFITCAVDPYPQLLIAPAFAIPRALNQAGRELHPDLDHFISEIRFPGLSLDDIDVFEIHEAFAAQVE